MLIMHGCDAFLTPFILLPWRFILCCNYSEWVFTIAYQLLEAIGALTKEEAAKANSRSAPYQDATTEDISRSQDDLVVDHEDEPEDNVTEDWDNVAASASVIGKAVFKVSLSYLWSILHDLWVQS